MSDTVELSSDKREKLGDLYDLACEKHSGFAAEHKVAMARVGKRPVKFGTVERLIDAIEAVLSVTGLNDAHASTIDGLRAYLRGERARSEGVHLKLVEDAVDVARKAAGELTSVGMPPTMLPALAIDKPFVASTDQLARFAVSAAHLVAAIHTYLDQRGMGAQLAPWSARLAQLAGKVPDLYAAEEAARLVDLACRWTTTRFASDHQTGTITMTGPLVEPPVRGRLALVHLEAAIELDRWAYRQNHLVGALEFGRAWLERYPFAIHVVATQSLERVLGYITALPMALDDLAGVLRSGDDAHVPGESVSTCNPGERVYLYIPSVVIRTDCDRLVAKSQLRASFLRGLRWLRERGALLEAIVAVGYTESGRELLRAHGFEVASTLEARLNGSALLHGEQHLCQLVRAVRPPSEFGQQLHDAAFGP